MVKDVAVVYGKLPQQDKEKAVIFARNYGDAGAIELFGPRYGLPAVISYDNNYMLWGSGNVTGDLIISIGLDKVTLDGFFEKVELAGVIHKCEFSINHEYDSPVFVCRKMKVPPGKFLVMLQILKDNNEIIEKRPHRDWNI
jgi:hypothetical protein